MKAERDSGVTSSSTALSLPTKLRWVSTTNTIGTVSDWQDRSCEASLVIRAAWLSGVCLPGSLGPETASSTNQYRIICRPFNEPLFASLLDGKVVAVDPESGRNLWSFDSGLPLVSASNFQPDRSIFPGADGVLYVYKADSDNKQGVEVSRKLL